ncbi:helix-turn-helix transcriptional regulator [uncultured Finegoldia sp.]|uniref:ArsR/SmtB family transcription factor n=1 Tax=uncultured Finegoldia sp. TaxID=328009 RepID=UPI0026152FB6|nr:metalloregulator ArsR/SmtB family transcription factor [uncultured Finegoldia sp.]
MNNKQIADTFKALSDEKRIDILQLLQNGEQCACVLLEKLNLTQSGLSYHMKILTNSQIIQSRQVGKWTYYKISEKQCSNLMTLLIDITKLNDNNKERTINE